MNSKQQSAHMQHSLLTKEAFDNGIFYPRPLHQSISDVKHTYNYQTSPKQHQPLFFHINLEDVKDHKAQ